MSRLNLYVEGQVVHASVTLRSTATDALSDPTTLTAIVVHPDGTETSYVFGTDAELIHDSLGLFHIDIACDEPGEWGYRFVSTGTAAGAGQKSFYVNRSIAA